MAETSRASYIDILDEKEGQFAQGQRMNEIVKVRSLMKNCVAQRATVGDNSLLELRTFK